MTAAWESSSFPIDLGRHEAAVEALARQLAATAAERDREGGSAKRERDMLRASGLLTLAVPRAHGGPGETWPLIMRATRRLAAADSSLAHLFGFQHLQVASVILFGSPRQHERFLRATVDEGWFWGNAVNARDVRLTATRRSDGWVLDGAKSFCSGALDSDVLDVSFAVGPKPTDRLYAVVPTQATGVKVLDDWDNMGQRQTDSGTVEFTKVLVPDADVLGPPGAGDTPRSTLRNILGQLVLTEIYLGNAMGALQEAIDYVRTQVRPWPQAGVERAVDDPLLQLPAGSMWTQLRSACVLADHALEQYQVCWDLGEALSPAQRGRAAMDIAAARAHAGQVALDITSRIFELTGARSTTRSAGLDRYWRNVRVHTLHDPLDQRLRGIGRWLLDGQYPDPHGYG